MTPLIIGAIVLMAAAFIISFKGYGWTAILAFIALWMVGASGSTLIVWGITALLVWGLTVILPPAVSKSMRGVAYIAGASAAATSIGLLAGPAGPVIGAVCGALFGGLAYGTTPDGKMMGFPSSKFFNYLAAKGFPAAVTMATIGEAVDRLI